MRQDYQGWYVFVDHEMQVDNRKEVVVYLAYADTRDTHSERFRSWSIKRFSHTKKIFYYAYVHIQVVELSCK